MYKGKAQKKNPIFIVKPEAACQGKGIFLAKDMKEIENYYKGTEGEISQFEMIHCVV